jgi:2-polyprenyl-3-methyl-5-hydroxy-6-metoxy-1,4-benzoquinol methylase
MDKTKQAASVFDKHATVYQQKFMDVSLYHDSLDTFCESVLRQDAQILDVACGPGNVSQYLLSKRPAYDILGIDLAPAMITLAKINNPTADFQLMDGRDIVAIGRQYDGIICGFGLPYFSREEAVQFIVDAAKVLVPKGVLYISTMEDDYGKSGLQTSSGGDQLYMYFHQEDYLSAAMEKNKLTITSVQRIKYANADGSTTVDMVMIAVK